MRCLAESPYLRARDARCWRQVSGKSHPPLWRCQSTLRPKPKGCRPLAGVYKPKRGRRLVNASPPVTCEYAERRLERPSAGLPLARLVPLAGRHCNADPGSRLKVLVSLLVCNLPVLIFAFE